MKTIKIVLIVLLLSACSNKSLAPLSYQANNTCVEAKPSKVEWYKIIVPAVIGYSLLFNTL